MLDAKRCDYFPRAYHDIENELLNIKALYPDLIEYERILLHYPFAVYFYTNKSNEDLAGWIEEGLEILSSKGAIEKLMKDEYDLNLVSPMLLKGKRHCSDDGEVCSVSHYLIFGYKD